MTPSRKKPRTSVLQPLIAFHLGMYPATDQTLASSHVSDMRVQSSQLFLGGITSHSYLDLLASLHMLRIEFISSAYGGQTVSWTAASGDSDIEPHGSRSLCMFFQIVRANSTCLGSLRPASTTQFHVPGLNYTATRIPSIGISINKKYGSDVRLTAHRNSVWIRETNQMSLFVFFISLLIVAQHVSGNHVPIIRS